MRLLTATIALGLALTPLAAAAQSTFSQLVAKDGVKEKMLAKAQNEEAWLVALIDEGGVEAPGRDLHIEGVTYQYASTCRPHMCSDYQLATLVSPDGTPFLYVHGNDVRDRPLGDVPTAINGAFLTQTLQ